MLSLSLSLSLSHTHTHIYIFCVCVCVCGYDISYIFCKLLGVILILILKVIQR